MDRRFRALLCSLVLVLVIPFLDLPLQAQGQERQRMRRDAREEAPEALIGTWILNVEKSTYTARTPPRSQVRNFDYTEDGKILCYAMQVSADGDQSVFHWVVTLDGEEHPEWMRGRGSLVSALVGIKKIDERTLGITVTRHGTLIQTGEWKLSEDGNTLTQVLKNTRPNDEGVIREHVAVYDRGFAQGIPSSP